MSHSRRIASRFQIEELIGQGGMGDVYRGLDIETGQPVAIKALKQEIIAHDPDLVARFQREGEALRQLNHPNIVKMLAAIEEDDQYFLVMEYVGGGTLADLLHEVQENRAAPLPIARVLQIGLDLADALTRAHRLNIIHRDIKPPNVLLAEDGTPRLTDFGVAHIGGSTRVTETGAIIGTYAYISPEAFNGESLDARTDIWAFGVLLYEMVAGRRPFDEPHPGAMLMAILQKPVPDLQAIRPDVPVALADLIYRMLEKDHLRRIPSVRLVGAELEALVHGIEIDTSSVGVRPAVSAAPGAFATPTPTTDTPARQHNLPAQTTPFVGREDELADITRLLADPGVRLVTLLGPGGMGKTRLSLAAAEKMLNKAASSSPSSSSPLPPPSPSQWGGAGGGVAASPEGPGVRVSFPDGVYFVPLAPLDSPETIVPTIAESLKFSFYSADDPKMQLLDYLREKHMLLVMDNFEHLIAGAGLVSEMLQAAPGLKVLATSRERLRLTGETVLEVQGMRFPEYVAPADLENYASAQLFIQSARRVQPAFELDDSTAQYVAQIVRRVQGMPLGIELAAAWLEALTAQEIVKEIESSFDFLETQLRDVPERHRSLRAVFEYSWNLLTDEERDGFKRLSVFRGGFSRQAAQEVAGASLRALTALGNKSLLRRDSESGRYEIHELLRQYAAEHLAESKADHDAVQDRHCAYYADFLQKIEPDLLSANQKKALESVEAEMENIRLAWRWAVEHAHLDSLRKAAGVLDIIYELMSLYREGVETFRHAAEHLEKQVAPRDDLLLWRIRLHQGAAAGRMGDYALNREIALAALPIFKHWNAKSEMGLAYRNLAYVAMMQGHYAESRQYGEDGVAVSREMGDPWMLYMNLANLGYATFLAGEYDRARQIYDECLPLGDQLGNPFGMAYSRNNLGEVLHALGEEHEAKRLFEEAYAVFRDINNPRGMAFTVNNLGNVAHAMGDYQEALGYNQQSYDLMHEIGDRRGMADALNRLGGVTNSLGDYRQAQQYHRQALAISREIGDRRSAANALVQLGIVLMAEGEYAEAEAVLNEAVAIRREMGNPSEIADALQLLGLLATLSGNTDKAPTWLDEAMSVMQRAGAPDPIILGRDRAFRAVNYLFTQQWQEIKDCYGDLLPEFEARGIKWMVLQGNFTLTWAELGLGNLAQARHHAVKSLQAAMDLHTLDWAAFSITGLASILAAEGQLERAAELLSFAHDYPISQHFMRQQAARALANVKQQLPPDVYATAVERGKTLQFDNVVAQLLAELQYRA